MSSRRLSSSASINDIHIPPDIIKGYTIEALKELSNQDDGSFFEFFQGLDLQDVKNAQQRRQGIQEQNRELAVKTCEVQPRFEELKSELRQISTEVDSLKENYVSKYSELKRFQQGRDDNAVKTKLIQGMKDVENKSDDMASDFASGKSDLSVEQFKDQFLELRKTYWMRKVKSEKLDELIKNQRPTPAARAPRTPVAAQPQLAVPAQQHPSHSLPAHFQQQATPYPVEPRRPSEPTPLSSMQPPPYSVQPNVSMPRVPPPGHPFSSIPPSYHQGYPSRPPPRPPLQNSYAQYTHRY